MMSTGEDGPANNLRKTPGRIASQSLTKSDIALIESINNVDEEDSKSAKGKKVKTRRPTGKRVLVSASLTPTTPSQTLMKDYF